MNCRVYPHTLEKPYRFVVVFSKYQGKLLLSRHRERTTWGTQDGHIEPGETPLEAAKRELWEESGAKRFSIRPLCGYWAKDDKGSSDGMVFFAQIEELGELPESEMAETALFDALPQELTYPDITPVIYRQAEQLF